MTVVLSDLDGVLVDSQASIMRAWRSWGARHGLEAAAVEAVEHGRPSGEIVAALRPELDAAEESRALDALQAEDTGDVVALPGAADLLRGLGPDRLAVVTSCTAELAKARLRAAGLEPPPVLVTADRLRRGKPDPEGYLLAARELGADPSECVVLEDAPAGVQAGLAAGMRVVALLTTHAPEDLAGADERAASVAEWLARGPLSTAPASR
jgi:mannitol-1-/sugar-/sorbitol-6-phosphatase